MARLGSRGCRSDGFLRRGGEEAGLVASTGLPRPAAFKRLQRPENEILKSGSQPQTDCCRAINVISKAAGGACRTPQPSLSPLNWSALAAQAIDADKGPRCSTSRRKEPDVAAGGGAR